MSTALLLTGTPGSGKTTAIQKVLARLQCHPGGFYTRELRRQGRRQGFELVTLDGQVGTLAHVDFTGVPRIGRYGVDLQALDRIGVQAIRQAIEGRDLVVIDEIGSMELLSPAFRQVVLEALASQRPILGSITRRQSAFTRQVAANPRVQVLRLHPGNRAQVVEQALDILAAAGLKRMAPAAG